MRLQLGLIVIGILFLKPATASEVTDDSFRCILKMSQVGHVYVDNLMGNIEQTVAVANNPDGGQYPEGSLLQQTPTEAMVKRSEGFNPATNDWEFFTLQPSAGTLTIQQRGGSEVTNADGDSCAGCHAQASPKWDMTCGAHSDCAPLRLTRHQMRMAAIFDERCDQGTASKTRNERMFFLQHRLAEDLVQDFSKEPQEDQP